MFLDLDDQALANDYRADGTECKKYPLRVARCEDCTHCQLMELVEPEILFTKYSYVSGTSNTLREWFDEFAYDVQDENPSCKWPVRVLDIACNDGTLLESFKKIGCEVHGVDPAENLREITKQKGIPVEVAFWDSFVARKLKPFDLITAFNVLAHTPDPLGFLVSCIDAMSIGARLYVLTSQSDWMENGEFDCVYHEHVSYFNEESMRRLASRAGFEIESFSYPEIHGGSMLTTLVNKYRDCELKERDFHIESNETIRNLRMDGWKVIGYGAAAKASVVIQATKLDVDFVVDENPMKHGMQIPGTSIAIVSPSEMIHHDELAIVLFAWNFGPEIIEKVKLARSGVKTCFVYLPGRVVYETDSH